MKVLRWLDRNLEETILILILFYLVVMAGVQVFTRYVMGDSLAWTEESIRYMFIWMVFIGFSLGVKHERHISIDILLAFMPDKVKSVVKMLALFIFLAFCLVATFSGVLVVMSFWEFTQLSPVLEIPVHYVYAAAPVGFGLTSIRLIQKIIGKLKAPSDLGGEHA